MQFLSESRSQTITLGKTLARFLKKGDIICLNGDLGSGKTTFTKGLAAGLKINQQLVNSPTFVLLNEYRGKLPLYHFDLYRIDEPSELLVIGYEEFLYGQGVSVVEWASKLGKLTPKDYLDVKFAHKKESKRLIKFLAHGKRAKEIVQQLESKA